MSSRTLNDSHCSPAAVMANTGWPACTFSPISATTTLTVHFDEGRNASIVSVAHSSTRKAREVKPAKAAPKGPFWVQVLATKKAQAADELMKRLKDEGFAADVSAAPGKDGWFRVRVGPFKDRAKAEATARKIKVADKQIKNKPLVTP